MDLRLAYFLPEPLKQYVGPVGTYADVDEILQQNMQTMKVAPSLVSAAAQRVHVLQCYEQCLLGSAGQCWPLHQICAMLSCRQRSFLT